MKMTTATTANPTKVNPMAIIVEVKKCQRCGKDHSIAFSPLSNPSDEFDHWGICQNVGEPVFMSITEKPKKPKVAIVIPARLNSSRLPRKLLLDRTGKPLIVHTYEHAKQSKLADSVTVATDSREIVDVCHRHNADCLYFEGDFRNGTQRVAMAIRRMTLAPHTGNHPDIIVNLQGDSVGVTGEHLDRLISHMIDNPRCKVATIVAPFYGEDGEGDKFDSSHSVKVAVENGRCHWFSRAPIRWSLLHVGAYAFRSPWPFDWIHEFNESEIGDAEDLEQLDWLVAGLEIEAVEIDDQPISINTAADYERFCELKAMERKGFAL